MLSSFRCSCSLRKHPFLLALRRWGHFARNVPGGEERGETDVFAGYCSWRFIWYSVSQYFLTIQVYSPFTRRNRVRLFSLLHYEQWTEWFAEKGKRPNILMRNSLKDEKLLEKSTYTSVNCLWVFGFYISILLFMSTASSKLNFKHRAWMQSILQGSSGEALLSATDLVYNMR